MRLTAYWGTNEMRILVFGNSGSGKSTYARARANEHGEHLDLDSIVWEPAQIGVQRPSEAIMESLGEFLAANSAWIIEGCYGELVEAAAPQCTELVFLNPGLDACLANNLHRPWEPQKFASLEQQNAMLDDLQEWVRAYYTRDGPWSYETHRRVFDSHPGEKVEHGGPATEPGRPAQRDSDPSAIVKRP